MDIDALKSKISDMELSRTKKVELRRKVDESIDAATIQRNDITAEITALDAALVVKKAEFLRTKANEGTSSKLKRTFFNAFSSTPPKPKPNDDHFAQIN